MTKEQFEAYKQYDIEKQYLVIEQKKYESMLGVRDTINDDFLNILISAIKNEIEAITIKQGEL